MELINKKNSERDNLVKINMQNNKKVLKDIFSGYRSAFL